MKPTSKEEFMLILDRQQKSGMSIRDFCANESYSASGFHYWKSKFGLSRAYNNQEQEMANEKLSPISLNLPVKGPLAKPVSSGYSKGEVSIKLPGGIRIRFIGSTQTEAAINLLNPICSIHVLPE
jgi:putative transposase